MVKDQLASIADSCSIVWEVLVKMPLTSFSSMKPDQHDMTPSQIIVELTSESVLTMSRHSSSYMDTCSVRLLPANQQNDAKFYCASLVITIIAVFVHACMCVCVCVCVCVCE